MLRKHAARFGEQLDQHLSCALWAYRNTSHDSAGEKPSFLLFGWDLRSPTEAAFMKPTGVCTYIQNRTLEFISNTCHFTTSSALQTN